jgi:hypothetical protein
LKNLPFAKTSLWSASSLTSISKEASAVGPTTERTFLTPLHNSIALIELMPFAVAKVMRRFDLSIGSEWDKTILSSFETSGKFLKPIWNISGYIYHSG